MNAQLHTLSPPPRDKASYFQLCRGLRDTTCSMRNHVPRRSQKRDIFCICIDPFNRPCVLVRCCVDIDLRGRLALTGKPARLPASAKDVAADRTARPAATRSPSRCLASNRSGPANPCARRPPGARASPSRQTHRTRQVTWMALTWSVRKFKRQGV